MQNCHIRSQWETNLRQMKWWLQNRPNTKNGSLPVTALFFRNFCFSLRTSYKELICCTNNTNAHICTFCKHWSFIWWCCYPVSILNRLYQHFFVTFSACCCLAMLLSKRRRKKEKGVVFLLIENKVGGRALPLWYRAFLRFRPPWIVIVINAII